MDQKLCSNCNEFKPLKDFYKEARVKDGHMRRCKACHCKATERYRKENLDLYAKASKKYWNQISETKKRNNWLKRYGITKEEYETMYKKQNQSCWVCKKQCLSGQYLSVDHCHKTGKVRGLLCKKCNSALGMLDDDIELLETAIIYLKNSLGLI